MENSGFLTTALPLALAIIMLGLGLSLTIDDFKRVGKNPRAVLIALGIQLVILPAIAFGLIYLIGLQGALAVGVILLAASPGGTTANLFSHLFRGDVALNVSLTAINSVFAVFTLPLFTNFALALFLPDFEEIGLQSGKAAQVFAIVLVPVAIGMAIRRVWPSVAAKSDRPVRIFSIIVLAAITIGAIAAERENVLDYLTDVGVVTGLFCLFSLSIGYFLSRTLKLSHKQSVAASMEIGVHNTTIAMTIGMSVMGSAELAIPAAVYSILMYLLAPIFGFVITRGRRGDEEPGHEAQRPAVAR